MVKDILIGLSVGMIAGAFVAKNYKPYSDAVDAVSDAVGKQVKQMKKGKSTSTSKSKPKAQPKAQTN